ncbi:MAG: hypothetical protein PCFJNLEI_02009 [Verrucomicrobiae bacterium]|nr:hypothetical protein [Verrucomicrobiae bacterium]
MTFLCAILVAVESLSPTNQALAKPVLEHPTLRREYAPHKILGRVEHFEFLLDHMDVCSVVSEQTGLIDYRAVAQPDGRLYAENKEQAKGFLSLIGCEPGRRIFYMEGTQRGLFTAKGAGVIVLDYKQITPTEMECRGRLFVRIENSVVATLARMFFVFLKGAVDRNYRLVIAQPLDLTQLASGFPQELREFIATLTAADQALVEPFTALLAQPPQ